MICGGGDRCGDDDLLGLIADVEIDIDPDIAGAGSRRAERKDGRHETPHAAPAESSEHIDTLLEINLRPGPSPVAFVILSHALSSLL